MILDWREMAGRPTTRSLPGEGPWKAWNSVWSGGRQVGLGSAQQGGLRSVDPVRCWIIAICWIVASATEYVLAPCWSPLFPRTNSRAYTQRVLPLHPHPPPETRSRLRPYPSLRPPRHYDLLRRGDPHVCLLLDSHVRKHRRYRHLCRAIMCQARDARGSRGRTGA